MKEAIALIDANNFYASCEQMINPSLAGKPIVILSNNDGCIVSRSSEARKLRIENGKPYFKIKNDLKRLNISVLSSNYSLYGDMSQRLMILLERYCEEIEIYSIDEAFLRVSFANKYNLNSWAYNLREIVQRDLGIPISIGIGINKVHAKLANHIAKKEAFSAGVFDFIYRENKEEFLKEIKVENVWGIGFKLASWCKERGIKNALELRDMPTHKLKNKCGIVGVKLQDSLKGEKHTEISNRFIPKKELCVSRSFSRPITTREELWEAISNYITRAGEKLRKQNQYAAKLSIFARTSKYNTKFYTGNETKTLNLPTNDTNKLLKFGLELTMKVYKENYSFMKAGVIMRNLQNCNYLQQHLEEKDYHINEKNQENLMRIIDNLNRRYGDQTLTWACCGKKKGWYMKREKLSAKSTTKYNDIAIVNT